jgi:NADH dehydrogenase (ubiquinone) Fe-S protein 6
MLTIIQANEHNRKHLESLPETPYPLSAQGDTAEINETQRITDEGLEQR